MSTESELLRLVASPDPSQGAIESVQHLMKEPLDWGRLWALALRNGMLPLLYWNLNRHAKGQMPGAELTRMRAEYLRTVQANMLLTGEMLRLLSLLEKAGVSPIAFKGPVLALQAYGQVGLRSFRDLDLMVARSEVDLALRLMADEGYRPQYDLPRGPEKVYLATDFHHPMIHQTSRQVVEIHWDVAPSYYSARIDVGKLRERATTVEIGGVPVTAFDPVDTILLLSLHGAKHGWERLEWIASLAAILSNRQALDVSELIPRARAWGIEKALLLGCRLTHDILDVPLPEPAKHGLTGRESLQRLSTAIQGTVFDVDWQPSGNEERFQVLQLHLKDAWRDQVRYLWRALTTPSIRDLQAVNLPTRFIALYWLIRPTRAAVEVIRLLARRREGVSARS